MWSKNGPQSLPNGVFDKLTKLKELSLSQNQLQSLTNGVFDKLTSLTHLFLYNNQLKSVPVPSLVKGCMSSIAPMKSWIIHSHKARCYRFDCIIYSCYKCHFINFQTLLSSLRTFRLHFSHFVFVNFYPRRRRGYCIWIRLFVCLFVCLSAKNFNVFLYNRVHVTKVLPPFHQRSDDAYGMF